MGTLFELDGPAALPGSAQPVRRQETGPKAAGGKRHVRYVPRRCRRLWIARDTPILPGMLAGAVWAEASTWLGVELPREWIRRLAVRADVIYFHNPRFRRGVRRHGNAGRDYLLAFMRHWLAAMIRRRDHELFTRLPASFCTGHELPDHHHGHAD